MRRQRKAKIVATLGPASSDIAVIRQLFDAGADVFRLNFSHGTHEDHRARYDAVRQVEAETGRPIAILADLQGPKLRIGTFAVGKVAVKAGDTFLLDSDPTPGDATRVYLPHPELFRAASAGQSLLIDDGKVRLNIVSVASGSITTRVANNGTLSDRKGVNVPDAVIPIPALTDKDRRDLALPWSWARTGSRCPSCSGPRYRRGARDHRHARGRAVEDREAGGVAAVGRDRACVRRGDGGARRPRRGTAARARARRAEAHPAHLPPVGQTHRHRHADAGIDDRLAGAHARRGLGRGQRHLRRRRCRDAVRRIGQRPASSTGGIDDGPDHHRGGAGPAVPQYDRCAARGAALHAPGCDLRGAARGHPDHRRAGHGDVHVVWRHRAARRARAAVRAHRQHHAES